MAKLALGGLDSFSPGGQPVTHHPCPDLLTTNACFGGPDVRALHATQGTTDRLIAFGNWPPRGPGLNCQVATT